MSHDQNLQDRLEVLIRAMIDLRAGRTPAQQEFAGRTTEAIQSEVIALGEQLGFHPDEIKDIEKTIIAEMAEEHMDPGAQKLSVITKQREFTGEFYLRRLDLLVASGWFFFAGAISLFVHSEVPSIGVISVGIGLFLFMIARAGVRRFRVEADGTFWIAGTSGFKPIDFSKYPHAAFYNKAPRVIVLSKAPVGRIRRALFPFGDGPVFIFLGHWRRRFDKAYLMPDILTNYVFNLCKKSGFSVEETGRYPAKEGDSWQGKK